MTGQQAEQGTQKLAKGVATQPGQAEHVTCAQNIRSAFAEVLPVALPYEGQGLDDDSLARS